MVSAAFTIENSGLFSKLKMNLIILTKEFSFQASNENFPQSRLSSHADETIQDNFFDQQYFASSSTALKKRPSNGFCLKKGSFECLQLYFFYVNTLDFNPVEEKNDISSKKLAEVEHDYDDPFTVAYQHYQSPPASNSGMTKSFTL
jgi:hypothetical protein